MSTGQMLWVIGAFVLLSSATVCLNRALTQNDETAMEARVGLLAVSVCQGRLEALATLDFDSLAVGDVADTLSGRFGALVCSTRIGHVIDLDPDSIVSEQTGLKRISVTVSGGGLSGGITMRALAGNY